MTPAARNAAYRAGRQLAAAAAAALGAPADRVRFSGGALVDAEDPSKRLSFAEATKQLPTEEIRVTASRSADYGGFERGDRIGIGGLGGVQFAEVEVDVETGIVKVERVVAVHDCGRPVNRLALESQINGGILQGISYALFEDRILDRETGKMVNANLDQYKIVGSRETPVIEPIIIEQYHGRSSTDVGGIGEPATVPTSGAIANAVYNAIGVRVRELPMTPDVILRALARRDDDAKQRSAT
jgi:xanthine dehydrogenase YagR molybdenum-binding subunit